MAINKLQPLVETVTYTKFLMEAKSDGRYIARGEFGRVDVPTLNNRVYPRKNFEPALESLGEKLKRKQVYGELDHPDDGKTKLTRASHIITNLTVQDDGVVMGEAEILPTPNGKILRALIEAGCEVGVSSRGRGSTTRNKEGHDVVGEDFALVTYDFVAEPAMSSALPQFTVESIMEEFSHADMEEIKSCYPDLYEEISQQIKANLVESKESKETIQKAVDKAMQDKEVEVKESLKREFADKLKNSMAEIREEAEAGIRKALMEDPQVGGATALLTQIANMVASFEGKNQDMDAIAKDDAIEHYASENEKLKEENMQLIASLQEAVNIARLETEISGHPYADEIREDIGDVSGITRAELMEEIDRLIDKYDKEVVEDYSVEKTGRVVDHELEENFNAVSKEVEVLRTLITQKEKEIASLKESRKTLEKEYDSMVEEFNKQTEELEEQDLVIRKYESVIIHPNAGELFEAIENVKEEKIDKVIQKELSRRTNESVRKRGTGRGYTKKLTEDIDDEGNDSFVPDTAKRSMINSFRVLSGLDR